MDKSQLRLLVRDRLGLQIGEQMTDYLAAQRQQSTGAIPVIGQDARTGIPRREMIDPHIVRMEPP